ncbi:MAG TPA: type I restriction-modification system subunit M [Candidatus Lachnoclostridium pullistercoris]|uniref:site-specific DNA-methyltransferase (adenine-specific) n=1 Tax=Candidatus Lachnoclostridium pullistercoris TaxID=2838632 RepID=A0A9D2T471_9FIRM|nr:type I restriction-modification system subunit M [Candidatus Lachnoclostridium pullistercoris]
MDASKFKDYILSIIFYRYLSECAVCWVREAWDRRELPEELSAGLRTSGKRHSAPQSSGKQHSAPQSSEDLSAALQSSAGGESFSYEAVFSGNPSAFRKWSAGGLGFVIEPRHLFSSLIKQIEEGTFSVSLLREAVEAVTASPGTPEGEAAFDGIFDSLDLNAPELGKDEDQRTRLILRVLLKINGIPFGAGDAAMDVLGTTYMILIGLFASDAGKKGGEFFTPVQFSRLCARLACQGLSEIPSACDPAMGSASMLLEIPKAAGSIPVGHFYGQEKNRTTYNLARMNMLIHGIPCGSFSFYNDDTIASDQFGTRKFRVQVANPPYSQKWDSSPEYLKDPRFSGPGRLAPRSYEDYAFLLHMIWHMDEQGQAAVLLPHGVLFRGGAEAVIRTYIVETLNVLDAVIGLPAGCFHSTPIPVCCLVFKQNRGKNSGSILFVDASGDFIPGKKQNSISDEALERIAAACEVRRDQENFCRSVPLEEIRAAGCSLTISRYIRVSETEPAVDLKQVQEDLKKHRAACRKLEQEVNEYLSRLGL